LLYFNKGMQSSRNKTQHNPYTTNYKIYKIKAIMTLNTRKVNSNAKNTHVSGK